MTSHPYLFIWLAVAGGMGGLLGLAEHARHPLNDPDLSQQRTGILMPAGEERAPSIQPGWGTRRGTIILFARTLKGRHLFRDLADQSDLTSAADLIVVTHDESRPVIETGIHTFLTDHDESIARAFGLRRPIDGGYPVGYVIVDAQGFIRFRTLDAGFDRRAWEMKLLLSGTR